MWIVLLVLGFALISWPALGAGIQASQGPTPTDFVAALYYNGYNLATLGMGDIVPKTGVYRTLAVAESLIGFCTLTLALTYLISIYNALVRRNVYAMTLQHATGDSGDAARLLAGLGAGDDWSGARQRFNEISRDLMDLFESHHSYPLLHYFRFTEPYYAMARIALVPLETMTLARSALAPEQYAALIESEGATSLWHSGMHLLTELSQSVLPDGGPSSRDGPPPEEEKVWRERYQRATRQLERSQIALAPPDEGARRYLELRAQWQPYVAAFARYMGHDWAQIAPADQQEQ